MKDRVKYYPPNDMCYGHNLSKIETMQIPSFDKIDVNDSIEFFQIERYFNEKVRSKNWSDAAYEEYKEKCKILSGLAKRFFNQIDDDNIIDYYNNIEIGYLSDFWTAFDNCKLFRKIKNETFKELINGERISPSDLFLHKNIVHKYGNELKEYIIQNRSCISIVLHVYEQEYTGDKKMFLPEELSGDDINNYLESYIDGEYPNINYLNTIIKMNSTKRFPITDEIRLKAEKRYEKVREETFKTGTIISNEIQISFEPNQCQEIIETCKDSSFSVSYSTKWLLETLDYPSILNNFIYLFWFVDVPQMRFSHVNRQSQSGVFERAFASKSSREYPCNHAFSLLNGLASVQMHAYYDFLAKHNIRLEDVIRWFFTEQIQSEFVCAKMRLSMPSPGGTYLEKCNTIISAFESVLKQYYLYVKNGEIDFELVKISTTPIPFANIKSIVDDKYIYGVGDDYKWLSSCLVSDQCTFSFVERIYKEGRYYDCLIDLLLKETVYISDYRKNERAAFEKLAGYDLISIGNDGKIMLKNVAKLNILRDLFQNDVISQWHYSPAARKAIADFMEQGIITTQSTLFSQPEISYLNYLLNRSEFDNGLQLRNQYSHGTQQVNTNEEEHKQNYLLFLRLFILLAIKVNDEFLLREDKKKNDFKKISE